MGVLRLRLLLVLAGLGASSSSRIRSLSVPLLLQVRVVVLVRLLLCGGGEGEGVLGAPVRGGRGRGSGRSTRGSLVHDPIAQEKKQKSETTNKDYYMVIFKRGVAPGEGFVDNIDTFDGSAG